MTIDKSQQRERFEHLWNERYPEMPQWSDAFIFDGGNKLMDEAWSWYQLALSQPAVAGAVDEEPADMQAKFDLWRKDITALHKMFPSHLDAFKGGYSWALDDLRTASPSQPAAE